METTSPAPTPDEAATALADAEAMRALVVRNLVVPRLFSTSIGAAVAVQIAATAVGLTGAGARTAWFLAGGVTVFVVVAAVQLIRFRRLNGVWVGGLASRVVGGTATAASVSYGLGLGGALWAAFAGLWWLVAVCAAAAGVGYAVSGRRWARLYRGEPARYSRGESVAWLAVLGTGAAVGLVLLVIGR